MKAIVHHIAEPAQQMHPLKLYGHLSPPKVRALTSLDHEKSMSPC